MRLMVTILLTLVIGFLFTYCKIKLEIVSVSFLHLLEDRILEPKGEISTITTREVQPALITATEARNGSNVLIIKLKPDG